MSKLYILVTGYVPKKVLWLQIGDYNVRVDLQSKEISCGCVGELFRQGGRDQKECKHIVQARKLLEVIKIGW